MKSIQSMHSVVRIRATAWRRPRLISAGGLLAAWLGLGALTPGSASANMIYDQTFNENTALNDGTGTGNEFTHQVARPGGGTINGLSVTLDIAGGFNGQLYAYLTHGSDGFSVLLNRVGRDTGTPDGWIDPGMHLQLTDSAANGDLHLYNPHNTGLVLTGIWAPDGRESDPQSVLAGDARSALLGSFVGETVNGSWTLYVEDLVSGQQATLNSWSLGIGVQTVPEGEQWVMTALVLAGLVAAMMSNIATNSMAASALFVRNVYAYLAPGRTDKQGVKVGRLTIVVVLVAGMFVALTMNDVVSFIRVMLTVNAPWGAAILLMFFWRKLS